MSANTVPLSLPRGVLMIDVAGTELTAADRARLLDPRVGGVILFARNWRDSAQLAALTAGIHALRTPSLIIAADHEGGRVQRFRGDGFTNLPSMRTLGARWQDDHVAALTAAQATGFVLASELIAHGVDLSFAPVLDLDYGRSTAIGSRALHHDPATVAALAQAVLAGMAEVGMQGVGKHFPGHGWVEADSHHALPVDERDYASLWAADLVPYRHRLLRQLGGVMPAHVVYSGVGVETSGAAQPAGFSPFWLREVLRTRLGFKGVIFSDDLNMAGARSAGDIVARVGAAVAAGCDMLLVCNHPELVDDLLQRGVAAVDEASAARVAALARHKPRPSWLEDVFALELHAPYVLARERVAALGALGEADETSMTAARVGN
ncbi:beta-hexosaminidase [Betaproteobacteria bacterium]|nr:beta-hexosaminidase [Betaproteobacteria bacterium]GHU23153.1 beta-hexosaminidase [Betaproteobacteria bacterium]GHU29055.1 beta-hexosaminidase [Betaproteobacteria bacterium]